MARRFAERFTADDAGKKIAEAWGGINPDVVEAAALEHDLGHPPFGHVAEGELSGLVKKSVGAGGFEGNAQSFRILTRLAVRLPDPPFGLNLTRATLNATLKYPWLPTRVEIEKYGAYRVDEEAFNFARGITGPHGDGKCAEAQIMDWADDITYSVHDTEDFSRAGLVPLHIFAVSEAERENFLHRAVERRAAAKKPFMLHNQEVDFTFLQKFFGEFCLSLPVCEPYSGTRGQRGRLAQFTSDTVGRFDTATELQAPDVDGSCLKRTEEVLLLVALLKELIGVYVFDNLALAAHEHGQRRVIRGLYEVLFEEATEGRWKLFPPQFRDEAADIIGKQGDVAPASCARLAADTIASMTDDQALRMHQRLTGQSLGPALDPIFNSSDCQSHPLPGRTPLLTLRRMTHVPERDARSVDHRNGCRVSVAVSLEIIS